MSTVAHPQTVAHPHRLIHVQATDKTRQSQITDLGPVYKPRRVLVDLNRWWAKFGRNTHDATWGHCVKNMTSSTKPEVRNVLQCRQRRTEPRPQATRSKLVKFGRAFSSHASGQTEGQTDRHTHHNTLHPSQGEEIIRSVHTHTSYIGATKHTANYLSTTHFQARSTHKSTRSTHSSDTRGSLEYT